MRSSSRDRAAQEGNGEARAVRARIFPTGRRVPISRVVISPLFSFAQSLSTHPKAHIYF